MNVVGHFPHAARGQLLRFAGHWVVHPKHGPQLSATTFEEVVPQSKEAIAAYLSSTVEGGSLRPPSSSVHPKHGLQLPATTCEGSLSKRPSPPTSAAPSRVGPMPLHGFNVVSQPCLKLPSFGPIAAQQDATLPDQAAAQAAHAPLAS